MDRIFAVRKVMGPEHHRVFMHTPEHSVSNQKENPERKPAILSDDVIFVAKSSQNKSSYNHQ
jgi:hypothetical protein